MRARAWPAWSRLQSVMNSHRAKARHASMAAIDCAFHFAVVQAASSRDRYGAVRLPAMRAT